MNAKPRKTLLKLTALLVILTLVPSGISFAQSPSRPNLAAPFDAEFASGEVMGLGSTKGAPTPALVGADLFQNGADRLTALQNNDGGWDWPLDDGNPNSVSPKNTVSPIARGLAEAYQHTNDANHLAALQDAGALLLAKTNNFSPPDGYLAAVLDDIFGGTTYTTHVSTNFYGPLAAGTYNRNGAGTLYDTAGYVNFIRTDRASQGIPNLAAWDLGMGLVGASMAGADTTTWIAGVKAEIDELDGSDDYDVIGLAGAVYGLAYVDADFDPTASEHAAATSLADLGVILAGYQLTTGGFTWNSNYMEEGENNETIQESAYAILALDKLDRATYLGAIENAADYIESVQLGTGGWKNWAGGGENNEVTGEALWGVNTAYPLPEVWVCPSGDCGHPGESFNTIQEGVDAVQVGGTVNVTAGTYTENPNVNKSLDLSGPNSGLDPNTGSRALEAVINGEVTIAADAVSVDGFRITNPSGKHGIYAQDRSVVHIRNNIIDDIGSSDSTTSGTNFGIAVVSSSALVDEVVIEKNLITDIAGGNMKSADGIAIGWSSGAQNVMGLLIQDNTINNITSDTSAYASGGRGAYGILINHGTGTTGKTVGAQVLDNTISNLEGLWAHAIGLEGNTPDALVQGNTISNLVDHKSPSDAVGVEVEDNAAADSVDIHLNRFNNVNVGVQNVVSGDPLVDAEQNWWSAALGPTHASNPSGTGAAVNGNVDFTPWCYDAGCTIFAPPFPTVLTVSSAVGPFAGAVDLSATLTSGGDPLSGKTVNFTLNGAPAGSGVTDASGVALVEDASLSGIGADVYPTGIGASFAGDASYASSSGTGSLTVTSVEAATFVDVPTSNWAWSYIESIYAAGITGGCGTSPLVYCPTAPVTRAQMAVFLLRGIHGGSYVPPAVGDSTGFNDVPISHWAAAWIKQLAAEGITSGCGGGNYCPEDNVTRDQLAVFLLRAKHGASYEPPAVGSSTGFNDVPTSYWAAAWIKQLAAEGITSGCGGGSYCPADPASRDQMAVFLQRTFNLPLP